MIKVQLPYFLMQDWVSFWRWSYGTGSVNQLPKNSQRENGSFWIRYPFRFCFCDFFSKQLTTFWVTSESRVEPRLASKGHETTRTRRWGRLNTVAVQNKDQESYACKGNENWLICRKIDGFNQWKRFKRCNKSTKAVSNNLDRWLVDWCAAVVIKCR